MRSYQLRGNIDVVVTSYPGTTAPATPHIDKKSNRAGTVAVLRRHQWTVVRLLSPIALLALWQAGSALRIIPERILPAPSLIADSGIQLLRNGQLADALIVSSSRVGQGLLTGGLIGIVLGVIVGLSRLADATVDPPLQMLRALPHLGLTPIFILWFGIGETPKIALIALGVAFPLYLNASSAIRQVDRRYLETATVLGFTRAQRLSRVILPSITPQLLVGLRQSLAIGWLSLIVAEQINADSGLGFIINQARDVFRIDTIIFGLVIYALLGIITDAIVRVMEHHALRYQVNHS